MKKYTGILIFINLFISSVCLYSQQKQPVDYVNVFTGTSNSRWMINPGSYMPFGMVKLGPDNQGNVWNGGYEYTISRISGFSHLHGNTCAGYGI